MTSTIPLIPIPIPTAIPVITPVELVAPYDIEADYSVSGKNLKVTAKIIIPKDVNPSSVVLYQYIDPTNPLQLQFYFVYDIDGTGDPVPYTCAFVASNVDSAGTPIKISKITSVYCMLKDADPKTSRGTVASVRSIGGGHGELLEHQVKS